MSFIRRNAIHSKPPIADQVTDGFCQGLLIVLTEGIRRTYLDIEQVAGEVARLQREPGVELDATYLSGQLDDNSMLTWWQVLHLVERAHGQLRSTDYYDEHDDQVHGDRIKVVHTWFEQEINTLFEEENMAWNLKEGQVNATTRPSTTQAIESMGRVLADPKLGSTLATFNKAVRFLRKSPEPDYQNAIKEASAAVEVAAKALFGGKSKLAAVLQQVRGPDGHQVPTVVAKAITGVEHIRDVIDGAGHGGTNGGTATRPVAEYAITLSSAAITYMYEVYLEREEEIPF